MDIKALQTAILNLLDIVTVSDLQFDGEIKAINKTISNINDNQDIFNVGTTIVNEDCQIVGKIDYVDDETGSRLYHIYIDPETQKEISKTLVTSDFTLLTSKDGDNNNIFSIYGAKRLNLFLSSDDDSIIPYVHQFYLDDSQLFNTAFNSVYDTYVNTFNVLDINNENVTVTVLIRFVNNDFYHNQYFICILSENTNIKLQKLKSYNM